MCGGVELMLNVMLCHTQIDVQMQHHSIQASKQAST